VSQQSPEAFHRLPERERRALLDIFRLETTGGFLLLAGAAIALLWANLAPSNYESVTSFTFGPAALNLDLSVATWAKDGLLAVFFLVVGLELKREFVSGELRNPTEAIVPMLAAVGGMAVPALVYVLVNDLLTDGDLRGWAIPAATDIAFALAVLAVIGSALPTALRAFLLTLAVVDDLLAILIIAIVFTDTLDFVALMVSLGVIGLYWFLQKRRIGNLWLYAPIWLVAWGFMHESGVHATIAAVAIGLATRATTDPGEHESPAEAYEHAIRPVSAAVAVPLFALFAAGVTVNGQTLLSVFTEPIGLGIVAGLVVGKTIGISVGTWAAVRWTRATLARGLTWADVGAVSMLAGIGFTVSLLIASLAFEGDEDLVELSKTAVLVASIMAAFVASIALTRRNSLYKRLRLDNRGEIPDYVLDDTRLPRRGQPRVPTTTDQAARTEPGLGSLPSPTREDADDRRAAEDQRHRGE
jgi:NhaA family Na+:H+ antiporter